MDDKDYKFGLSKIFFRPGKVQTNHCYDGNVSFSLSCMHVGATQIEQHITCSSLSTPLSKQPLRVWRTWMEASEKQDGGRLTEFILLSFRAIYVTLAVPLSHMTGFYRVRLTEAKPGLARILISVFVTLRWGFLYILPVWPSVLSLNDLKLNWT